MTTTSNTMIEKLNSNFINAMLNGEVVTVNMNVNGTTIRNAFVPDVVEIEGKSIFISAKHFELNTEFESIEEDEGFIIFSRGMEICFDFK